MGQETRESLVRRLKDMRKQCLKARRAAQLKVKEASLRLALCDKALVEAGEALE